MKTDKWLPVGLRSVLILAPLLLCAWAIPPAALGQERQQLTFKDLMQVRQIQQPSISPDGAWVALAAVPDRGDGEVQVYSTGSETIYSVPLPSGSRCALVLHLRPGRQRNGGTLLAQGWASSRPRAER